MEDDQDTVMGGERKVTSLPSHPSLPSHTSLEQPVISPTPHQKADPILAPSLIPVQSQSPSSGSERVAPQDHLAPPRMAPPDQQVKMRDSESSSADNNTHSSNREDSLIEPNSDWSDDEDASAKPGLPLGSLETGLCYDVRMRYHCELRPTSDLHPEDPRRIYYIYKELCKAGLVDDPEAPRPLAYKTLKRIPVREATEEELVLVHTNAHYAFVRSTKGMLWCTHNSGDLFGAIQLMAVRYVRRSARGAGEGNRFLHLLQSVDFLFLAFVGRRCDRDLSSCCRA